ncbi:N-formylglutamate amidohydrolase [Acetobacteraceae bacterium H6797]|nr:N-formylglutamate amidohydrolase [Acetobacteraceae bacterium H6797]
MDMPSPAPAAEETTPPFILTRPERQTIPVVFASPHSGRRYPLAFLAESRLDPHNLRRSEDSFVEELYAAAPRLGAPLLAATFPRVYCDANREPWELDPTMFEEPLPEWVNSRSPRVGAGLGTIARIVANGEPVYRRRLRFAEAETRVRDCWQPYHAALAQLIAETRAQFGRCLLIDCHSMPSYPGGGLMADVVLGDAHGTACSPKATRLVETFLTGQGYRVRRNDPYAGGYVTRHYGRPREQVHALQIELARGLYMNEARIERASGFTHLQTNLTALIGLFTETDWAATLV